MPDGSLGFLPGRSQACKERKYILSDQLIYLENANRAFELCSFIRASTFGTCETCSNT